MTEAAPGTIKVPPDRSSWLTCWAIDIVVGLAVGVGALLMTSFLLQSWQLNPTTGELELKPWVAYVAVIVGGFTATAILTFGSGGRSLGHSLAEIRIDGPDGMPARWWRRLLRAALPVAVAAAVASRSVALAAAVTLALWAPSLLRADRRGIFEWIAGVRDFTIRPARLRAPL